MDTGVEGTTGPRQPDADAAGVRRATDETPTRAHGLGSSAEGRRIAVLAGGTAGHVYPAFAFTDAYRQAVPRTALVFLGAAHGVERPLVEARGERFVEIASAPFFRVGVAGKVRAVSQLARGFAQARRLLRRERIDLAIGFGGYVSAGTLLAARSLGLPTVIHEANLAPGLANRMLGHVVDRVCLGFADAATAFRTAQTVLTGIPVRPAFFEVGRLRTPHDLVGRPLHLLVTGGSEGSPFLNAHAAGFARALRDRGLPLTVRHQSGPHSVTAVAAAYQAVGIAGRVEPYITDMAAAYGWADLALTCAGAITVVELAAAGLPALLVPLATASEDHQRANARWLAEHTGLPWMPETGWDPARAAAAVLPLCTDPVTARSVRARLLALAPADAAQRLVTACEALLAGA